jgi:diguanylate cyclase (GGDEF)-like protein
MKNNPFTSPAKAPSLNVFKAAITWKLGLLIFGSVFLIKLGFVFLHGGDFESGTVLGAILSSILLSAVILLVISQLLIRPILFLRASLQAAATNPEKPPIVRSPFSIKSDLGVAISLTQNLIKANAKNIREIRGRAQDQIHKLAYYDSLTKLPNRVSFLEKLNDFKKRNDESPYESQIQTAVIALDLDHFKDINDSMGHNVGDAILKAVGHRLRSALPETAIVARVGEDEFAIAMPLVGNVTSAKVVAEKIQSMIRSAPFSVFKENFQLRTSLGVATFPNDAHEPEKVLKNADIALNRAKEEGRDTIREYSKDFDIAVQARFQMLRDLRDALEHKQLSLNYQPQLDLNTGKVIGAEALLRWWKPDPNEENGGHFISPVDFIPVAEQSGLIVPIGEWVMKTACKKAVEWHTQGHDIRIAVNVSGAQFHQSDIVNFTRNILEETGIAPHLVELEVTESVFMDDINHTVGILQELHALGVELAIDDFGTGYSSLSYLRQFPIDRLKIDQSFIKSALEDKSDASIAKTIIALGHSLNLKVIAEGVETKEHEVFLKEHNCDEVQGFRYSRPVVAEEFDAFIKSYSGTLDHFK